MERVHSGSQPIDLSKRYYFVMLGIQNREALRMHKLAGLWDKNAENKRD